MSGHEIHNSGHFDEEHDYLKNLFPKHTHQVLLHKQKIWDGTVWTELAPRVFETSNGWHIEGDFLILNVYDEQAKRYRKQAHRIPSSVVAITEERIFPLGDSDASR